MIVLVTLLAADNVPQDPWPFVIVGYVIMALGLVAVAVETVVRGRRLARRVPEGQRRWLDVRAAEIRRTSGAATTQPAPSAEPADPAGSR